MIVFNGTTRPDGWAMAHNWATSQRADVSCLWFDEATGKVETLTIVWHWNGLAYSSDRSWGGLVR